MERRFEAVAWAAVSACAWVGCGGGSAADGTQTGSTSIGSTSEFSSSGSGGMGDEIRRLIDEAAKDGFSGTILVTIDGETVVLEGHDFANRELEVLNAETTAFDFGSVMKDVTAAAIFKLQDDGALAVSEPLGAILPDVPPDKAEITVLDVVQHRAGFSEYHDTQGDFEPLTRLEARARILGQTLLFEPGSADAYSNAGYTLLADIVQTVSGREFTDYVRESCLSRPR